MNIIVSKRTIEGRKVYRVHHIMEDQLVGLEAVEKTAKGEFKRIYNWNDNGDLEDYMNDMDDIKEVSEFEKKAVLEFLKSIPIIGKKGLEEFLAGLEETVSIHQFLVAPFGHFAITQSEEYNTIGDADYFRAYNVVLDRSGKFRRIDAIVEQHELEIVLINLAMGLKDNSRLLFTYQPFVTCGLKRTGDLIEFVFMQEYRDEQDTPQIKTSINQTHQLRHDPKTNAFTTPEEEWAEADRQALLMEMLTLYTQVPADQINVTE